MNDAEISGLTDGAQTRRRYFFDGYLDGKKKIINGETENTQGIAGEIITQVVDCSVAGWSFDAEEEIYFTLDEAKRGDITEEELLEYAIAWDKELEGITQGGCIAGKERNHGE